jgi:hypothetical protein
MPPTRAELTPRDSILQNRYGAAADHVRSQLAARIVEARRVQLESPIKSRPQSRRSQGKVAFTLQEQLTAVKALLTHAGDPSFARVTQGRVARHMRLSSRTVGRWLRAASEPGFLDGMELARSLAVSPYELEAHLRRMRPRQVKGGKGSV